MALARDNASLALKTWSKESKIVEYIPYSHHVSDTIIATRDAAYVAIWKIDGRSHDCASQDDVFRWLDELHAQLLGASRVDPRLQLSFWSYVHRHRVNDYPDHVYTNSFAQHVNEKHGAAFGGTTQRINDLYLAVVIREDADGMLKQFAKREKMTREDKVLAQQRCIKALTSINNQFKKAFDQYRGELLGMETYRDPQSKRDIVHCTALRFLKFLVDGVWEIVPVCRGRIYDYLSTFRPMFSSYGMMGENRYIKSSRRFAMLEMLEISGKGTEPGQLNTLLKSEYEFLLCQSFTFISRKAASGALDLQYQMLEDSKDPAITLKNALIEARDRLESGHFAMGDHHMTLMVYGGDDVDVEEGLDVLRTAMTMCNVVTAPLDVSGEAGYWAQLPANWYWRPRPAPITSENFCCFTSFHNYLSGKPNGNPWGPAVCQLKTLSRTPLYVNFHVSGHDDDDYGKQLLGNVMVLGKSGEGKTALVGMLVLFAQKFDPTTVIFDKDAGMQPLVLALGGRYYNVQLGRRTNWNPLQLDPEKHWDFQLKFVKHLVASDRLGLDVDDDNQIAAGLRTVMYEMPHNVRCLSLLLQSLPIIEREAKDRPSVNERLQKWCGKGEHAFLFDNPLDTLNLNDVQTVGFDVTDFISDDEKVRMAAISMYLTYRTDLMQDGRRFIRVRDEFHKQFEDVGMQKKAKDEAKTDRKKNTCNIWVSQEPGDAIKCAVGDTLIQQTATFILLHNDLAVEDDYLKVLKLTRAEYETLMGFPRMGRRLLIKQGAQSVVASFELEGNWTREMRILSGTPETAEIAEACVNKYGIHPDQWIPHFNEIIEEREHAKRK